MSVFRVSTIPGLFLGFATLLTPLSVSAATLYECTFEYERARGGGWVPEKLFVRHDPQTGKVEVLDEIIQHFVGNPIAGEVKAETKQRIGFGWTVKTKDRANHQVDMIYRFTYFKDGRPAQVTAQPGPYENNFNASGSCKLGKG